LSIFEFLLALYAIVAVSYVPRPIG